MRSIRTTTFAAGVGATALALVLAAPAPASAVPEPSEPLATGLAGPLQFDVADGRIYVSQAFAGLITKVRANGTTKDLVAAEGGTGGVATDGYSVAFTVRGGDEENPTALLQVRRPNGTVRTIADLWAFEAAKNPDARNEYGFRNLDASCADQVPAEVGGGYPYPGQVDSNPYALANAPGGGWYVADAGGNTILHVTPRGKISVIYVARPQKAVIEEAAAEMFGLPDCTIGEVYAFEPVPTDVEVNPRGALIVSLLPGGPEDASLGARGKVLRVALDGEFATLGSGFLGATNVAVGPGGRIFVAELFANQISLLRNGVSRPYVSLPSPAAVEYANGTLYASTDVFGDGSIVAID